MKNLTLYIFMFLLLPLFWWNCSDDSSLSADLAAGSDTGTAGSYARFMVVGNYFYVIDNEDIKTYSLDDPAVPDLVNQQTVGSRVESIFHLDGKLFIGSGIGMFIYTIQADGIPEFTSQFSYDIFPIYPCDPVVANATHAYVTLNTVLRSQSCGGFGTVQVNQLNVFDITNINEPQLINELPLTQPKGVGLDGDLLFVCDDNEGLKVFNVSDPLNLEMIAQFDTFVAYDVIPLGGLLLVVGPENVYQFDYSDPANIQLISTIPLEI